MLPMRRQRRRIEGHKGSWLTTYSDMVTLVLCFFVILFSMSAVDATKFDQVVLSMQAALGVMPGARVPYESAPLDYDNLRQQLVEEETDSMKDLYDDLTRFVEETGLAASVGVAQEMQGIVLRFSDSVLFDLGRAELKEEAKGLLRQLAAFLSEHPYHLRVEGHTDNLPIQTARFPSNWELSTARSTTVVRYFEDNSLFSPHRLSAVGYGEFRPLRPNDSEENRALNRRVDMVILRPSLTDWGEGG